MPSITFTPTAEEQAFVLQHVRAHLLQPGKAAALLQALYMTGYMAGLFDTLGVLFEPVPRGGAYFSGLRILGLAAGAGFLMLVAWSYARQHVLTRLLSAQQASILVPVTVDITPTTVSVRSAGATATLDWQVVPRVELLDDYLLIYTAVDSACFAPRRAFEQTQAFADFANLALTHQADSPRADEPA